MKLKLNISIVRGYIRLVRMQCLDKSRVCKIQDLIAKLQSVCPVLMRSLEVIRRNSVPSGNKWLITTYIE